MESERDISTELCLFPIIVNVFIIYKIFFIGFMLWSI